MTEVTAGHGTGTLVVDRSDRVRLRFSGPRAAESLTGLVTSDVLALAPGHGQYSAALTPKGKVIADLRILALEDHLLVDTSAAAGPGFVAMIRKYVNPRLAKYEILGPSSGDLGVFGAGSTALLRNVLGESAVPESMTDFSHTSVIFGGAPVLVVRSPDYGIEGYDLIAERPALEALRTPLVAAGGRPVADDQALAASRIRDGRPQWGIDMDDSMLAQEVDLDRLGAISFTKGCYTGQETVARVHYRGHVNRHLRGLRLRSASQPPVGADLQDAEGKVVGSILSSAPAGDGLVALALVRREVEPGSAVTAVWHAQSAAAEVTSLPMTP